MEDSIFFRRHSKRSFLDKPVPEDALLRILEAARWAPSANNNQPWRFVVVRDPARLQAFREALNRGNRWAWKAPVLIAVAARAEDDVVRKDDPVTYHLFACGLAVENLLLAAVAEGLMAHPMAGYSAPKVKAALDIPEAYSVVTVIALGYEGPIDLLDEETRAKDERPRTRKPFAETVAWDRWTFGDATGIDG